MRVQCLIDVRAILLTFVNPASRWNLFFGFASLTYRLSFFRLLFEEGAEHYWRRGGPQVSKI